MGEIKYNYLRTKKADNLKLRHSSGFSERDNLEIWSGQNATILPLRKDASSGKLFGLGGVVAEDGKYVDISAIENRVSGKYNIEKCQYKDEKVVYCGYLVNHWGHFLVEGVSRLWYLFKNDTSIDKYVFFIEENAQREIKGNYKEFLKLLDVYDKIEIINCPTKFREVVVPSLGYKWKTYYSRHFKEIFETIANNIKIDSSWNVYEKIYFSRSQLAKASDSEFGFEVLDDFFERNGFKILYPEKLSLQEMIFYIRNADVCATLSGSLPHNFLFAEDGKQIYIVERCVLNNEIQVDINIMKDLNVTYIDANIPIYPVNMSGPFIMGFNRFLDAFSKDNKMVSPAPKYLTKKYYDKCFIKYMKAYRREYQYKWFMEDWYVNYTDYLWEAYKDGYDQYKEYLDGNKPFEIKQYFSIRHIKQFIKRALKSTFVANK